MKWKECKWKPTNLKGESESLKVDIKIQKNSIYEQQLKLSSIIHENKCGQDTYKKNKEVISNKIKKSIEFTFREKQVKYKASQN